MSDNAKTNAAVELTAADIAASSGAVFCPNPKMPLWSNHPRVFLAVQDDTGQGRCPYCGTVYRLAPGVKAGTGH